MDFHISLESSHYCAFNGFRPTLTTSNISYLILCWNKMCNPELCIYQKRARNDLISSCCNDYSFYRFKLDCKLELVLSSRYRKKTFAEYWFHVGINSFDTIFYNSNSNFTRGCCLVIVSRYKSSRNKIEPIFLRHQNS